MAVGFVLILLAGLLTFMSQSSKYWPLLVVGVIIGFAATPFYYFFKSKGKTADVYKDAAINILSSAGKDELNRHNGIDKK